MPFQEGFVSDLVGRRATVNELPIGKVVDFLVTNPDGTFPQIDGLVIKTSQGPRFAPMDTIIDVDAGGAIALSVTPKVAAPPDEEALYLVSDLFDKQIVDVDGRKVVRINDIEIASTAGKLRVVAADIGISGLLRRLGLRRLGKRFTPWMSQSVPRSMISWDSVAPIRDASPSQVRLSVQRSKLSRMHPSELADVIGDLSKREAAAVIQQLDDETAADAFEHLDAETQRSIIDDLGTERAADIIEEMDADDAADLLAELPEEQQSQLLAEMNEYTAGELRQLVKYEDDTAGGLMTTDYVWIYPNRTAGATIQKIREIAPTSEFIYYLYVIDKGDRLLGVVTLRDLLLALPTASIERIMNEELVSMRDDAPARDVVAAIAQYDLLAIPVVDENGKMLGIVTVDDAIDAIVPERLARNLPHIAHNRRHAVTSGD